MLKRLFGFTVASREFLKGEHHTWSFKDALEWVACYQDDDVLTISRFGRLVAQRRPV